MNMSGIKLITGSVVVAASFVMTASAATPSVVYDNSDPTKYLNISVPTPAGKVEFGDEITLSGADRLLSALKIEYFAKDLSGDETATIHLYQNTGSFGSPAFTEIGSAGPVSLVNGFNNLTYTDPALLLPDTFIWTVSFSNVEGPERAELPIYNPPGVGSSLDDFWTKDSSGSWTLFRFSGGNPPGNFAANVTAVPEAGTIAYGLVGGLMVLGYLRSRMSR
jgi:hypothetical protein